ncbi:hypothetical protein KO465_08605 [Candidatus Micrarchaeota archaeon]|nr:hypothetical protein [Candidatus Micrarchaeota archaeon]
MNKWILIITLMAFVAVMGCVDDTPTVDATTEDLVLNGDVEQNISSDNEQNKEPTINTFTFTDEIVFEINLSADKSLYHSAEKMNLVIDVQSNVDATNVSLACSGIQNRFKYSKIVNLSFGINEFETSYTLPRCNVCGGIKQGTHEIKCSVSKGDDATVEKTLEIEIKQ